MPWFFAVLGRSCRVSKASLLRLPIFSTTSSTDRRCLKVCLAALARQFTCSNRRQRSTGAVKVFYQPTGWASSACCPRAYARWNTVRTFIVSCRDVRWAAGVRQLSRVPACTGGRVLRRQFLENIGLFDSGHERCPSSPPESSSSQRFSLPQTAVDGTHRRTERNFLSGGSRCNRPQFELGETTIGVLHRSSLCALYGDARIPSFVLAC